MQHYRERQGVVYALFFLSEIWVSCYVSKISVTPCKAGKMMV